MRLGRQINEGDRKDEPSLIEHLRQKGEIFSEVSPTRVSFLRLGLTMWQHRISNRVVLFLPPSLPTREVNMEENLE